jgi:citronellyl-CoA synthetase
MTALSNTNNIRKNIGLGDLISGMASVIPRIPALIVDGISTLILRDDDRISVGKILEENARKYANKPAILFEDTVLTHRELNDLVNRYAHYFLSLGIKPGQVVVVFLDNRPETLYITAALAKIRAIASLVNSNQRSKVLLHSISLKHDQIFAIGSELLDDFEEVRPQIAGNGKLLMLGISDVDNAVFPNGYRDVKREIQHQPDTNIPGVKDIRAKTPFSYIFTSGTTGMPKASVQTNRKWVMCRNWFGRINLALNSDDVIYVSIPFFHANALLIAWSCSAASGAAMAIRRKFSVSEFWNDVRRYNASSFIYIGEICRYLMNAPPSEKDQQHRVRKIIGNGMRPDIWNSFRERFNIPEVIEFYASSDGNLSFANTLNIDCSVGWCASTFAIVEYDTEQDEPIRDKKGFMKKVKTGGVGLMLSEITDIFPFAGYVDEAENERKLFRNVFQKGDTWFNTGDLMRDIGFKHTQFVDRVGDTFRWKGENVATAEVEEIIHQYPAVESCAVYGVSIPHTDGRAGMAAIVPACDMTAFDMTGFSMYLKEELPFYAVPVFVRFCACFEMTDTYKIKKTSLKKAGFDNTDPEEIIYVLLPGAQTYQLLIPDVLRQIEKGKCGF